MTSPMKSELTTTLKIAINEATRALDFEGLVELAEFIFTKDHSLVIMANILIENEKEEEEKDEEEVTNDINF